MRSIGVLAADCVAATRSVAVADVASVNVLQAALLRRVGTRGTNAL
jgi:hypothetical protein